MLFMVIERFRDNAMVPVYQRLRDQGRSRPAGLEYVDSWVEANFGRCFQLMRCDDPKLFQEWALQWRGTGLTLELSRPVRRHPSRAGHGLFRRPQRRRGPIIESYDVGLLCTTAQDVFDKSRANKNAAAIKGLIKNFMRATAAEIALRTVYGFRPRMAAPFATRRAIV